jgi:hypothetical protein
LAQIVALARRVKNPTVAAYPQTLNTAAKRALYDNLGKNAEMGLALDAEILRRKRDDWRGHPIYALCAICGECLNVVWPDLVNRLWPFSRVRESA